MDICKNEGCDAPRGSCRRAECNACFHSRKRYGITRPEAQQMLDDQGGVCAICSSPLAFQGVRNQCSKHGANVDHCHKTGEVRGILCGHCNRGLGLFFDDPELLSKAISYIEE